MQNVCDLFAGINGSAKCSLILFFFNSCMDASIAIKPVFSRFQSVIITSGVRKNRKAKRIKKQIDQMYYLLTNLNVSIILEQIKNTSYFHFFATYQKIIVLISPDLAVKVSSG